MLFQLTFLHLTLRGSVLLFAAILGAASALADPGLPVPPQKIDFNRDIRPILAENCLTCHGMDAKAREADLRLDVREEAIAAKAIAPGDLKNSEMWARITTTNEDDLMPPPKTKKVLTDKQKDLLKRWIEGGAGYAKHWAFIPPVQPEIPAVAPIQSTDIKSQIRTPLDAFILAKMQAEGVEPAAEVSPAAWLRRVTFDLTGLPPTLAEMDAFAADASPRAYERVVDRLLNSATYGETMANDWLDVARYADTYGRHEDADCTVWPYRDWVISAFNSNMPFDQFITWQTAGDMLPNPTQDMLIATCFNRLAQQSNEAGSDPEEFRIEQIADRIRTNGMAFLGLSVECARCHDHKFDPISQRDYYSLASFLNNIDELGLFYVYTGGTPPPAIPLYKPELEAQHDAAVARVALLEQKQKDALGNARKRFTGWLKKRLPPQKMPEPGMWEKFTSFFSASLPPRAEPHVPKAWYSFENVHKKEFRNDVDGKEFGLMRNIAPTEAGRVGKAVRMAGDNSGSLEGVKELTRCDDFTFALWLHPDQSFKRAVVAHRSRAGVDAGYRGVELILEDDRPSFALCHATPAHEIRIRALKPIPVGQWTHIACAYDGSSRASGLQIYINGKLAACEVVRDQLYRDVTYRSDWGDDNAKDDGKPLAFRIGGRTNDATFSNGLIDEFIFHDVQLSEPEIRQLALLPDTSKPEDWFQWYLRERDDSYRSLSAKLRKARDKENELSAQAIDFMIMKEWAGPKRPTHILARGQFNKPTIEVQPDTIPAVLPFPPELPRNRLGLAQWLTHESNPLPARVAVNRLWQHFYGKGIVSTSEDFGTQGQAPTHPELLDWLAATFRSDGWDVKKFCRQLVLSATYRRGSTQAAGNPKWYQSGPRYRLGAEQVRDAVLASSGLLVPEIGGPSVKPYQPAGLWEEAGTQHIYTQDHGASLYRRSFYTFWRRTLPPPSMTVFDAPTREFCKVRRERTNTPLQSLVLMNDPQFIEAARCLAERLVRDHSNDDAARARDAYRLLASDQPSTDQLAVLTRYLAEERAHFTETPADADELLTKNGERKPDARLPKAEVAATTLMVRLLLGFSETVMKP